MFFEAFIGPEKATAWPLDNCLPKWPDPTIIACPVNGGVVGQIWGRGKDTAIGSQRVSLTERKMLA